jgi:hypothetical protein
VRYADDAIHRNKGWRARRRISGIVRELPAAGLIALAIWPAPVSPRSLLSTPTPNSRPSSSCADSAAPDAPRH